MGPSLCVVSNVIGTAVPSKRCPSKTCCLIGLSYFTTRAAPEVLQYMHPFLCYEVVSCAKLVCRCCCGCAAAAATLGTAAVLEVGWMNLVAVLGRRQAGRKGEDYATITIMGIKKLINNLGVSPSLIQQEFSVSIGNMRKVFDREVSALLLLSFVDAGR